MGTEIVALLEELDELYTMRELAKVQRQETIDSLIPVEVRRQIEEVNIEFGGMIESADFRIANLEEQIKTAVIANGSSVKSEHVSAVYTRGRVTWDSKLLDGFSIAHPEIIRARKEGAPSVSIRKLG